MKVIYTVKETCEILKVSRRELMRMIERGEIAYTHRRKSHILFSKDVLEIYMKSIEVSLD